MRIFKKIPSLKILQTSVFAYPTETCYGLGCDALQPNLVKRIYQIKSRDFNKPVSWIVADIKMAQEYVAFSKAAMQLARKFWPGPLTLVLPVSRNDRDKKRTIALRVSSHPIAQSIVRKLNTPIIATSANLSGEGECYSVGEVISQFKNSKFQPDFIIDQGVLFKKPSSTVAKVVDNKIEILRQGECAIN